MNPLFYLCIRDTFMTSLEKVSGKKEMMAIMEQAKKDGKKHISFSEFDLFNKCGHKHLVFKHLALETEPPSIHLAFGDAIHASIERTIEDSLGLQNRIDFFRERFRKNMDDTMKGEPAYSEMDDFMGQGCNILSMIDFEALLRDYEVVAVEEPLYQHIYGNFYFKGFIDLVLKHKTTGRYLILDWKTSTVAWILKYKLADVVFLMQMKLYKYFWARKHDVNLSKIDVKYMVLNRLADKKNPKKGYGELQEVSMTSAQSEVRDALELVAKTIKSIHLDKKFPKAKFVLDEYGRIQNDKSGRPLVDDKPCMFCKLKGGKHPLCNSNIDQDQTLLAEHAAVPKMGK